MSVIIKSNVPFLGDGYLSTFKQISTTVDAAFLEYKNRVLADGGVINDESATFGALEFLFENNIYGKCNAFVSPKFGVKLSSSGGVEKAYSLDGVDLIGLSFGGAELPKIQNGYFKFLHNDVARTGSMLTTASPLTPVSVRNRFAWVFKVNNINDSSAKYLVGLSNHEDFPMTTEVAQVLAGNSGSVESVFYRHINNSVFNPSSPVVSSGTLNLAASPATICYAFDGLASQRYTYTSYHNEIAQTYSGAVAPLNDTQLYIDLGGAWKSSTNKSFVKADVSALMSLYDVASDVAEKSVEFIHNYF